MNNTATLWKAIKQSPTYRINSQKCNLKLFSGWLDRDYSPQPFTRIQDVFIECWMPLLPKSTIQVYLLLCKLSNRTGWCWPSVAYLASELDLSKRTVRRATSQLQEYELISKGTIYNREEHQQHNIYRIMVVKEPQFLSETVQEDLLRQQESSQD